MFRGRSIAGPAGRVALSTILRSWICTASASSLLLLDRVGSFFFCPFNIVFAIKSQGRPGQNPQNTDDYEKDIDDQGGTAALK